MTESCFDWQTSEFVCPRCLTRELVKLPMALETLASEAKAFAREHQRCREPIGPGERAWLEAAQAHRAAGHKVNEAVRVSGLAVGSGGRT